VALVLALVAILLLALIVHDVIAPPGNSGAGTRTVMVRRGIVSAAVSAREPWCRSSSRTSPSALPAS